MDSEYVRHAIFWVPRRGRALGRFGRRWTGWCADSGTQCFDWCNAPLGAMSPRLVGDSCRKGLHGTLSAPFKLAPGRTFWRLQEALHEIAETMPAVSLGTLMLTVHEGRVVLAPRAVSGRLERLQGRIEDAVGLVSNRRRSVAAGQAVYPGGIPKPTGGLHEDSMVERFCLPLTIKMDPAAAYELAAVMHEKFAGKLSRQQRITDVALMGDPGHGRPWRVVERFQLADPIAFEPNLAPTGMDWCSDRAMPPLNTVLGSNWETVIA